MSCLRRGYCRTDSFKITHLTYKDNVNVSTDKVKATITITGKGNYTGTVTKAVEFTITPADISKATVTPVTDKKYTGASIKPGPWITFNEKKLRESKGTEAEARILWAKDMLITGVEGTGLGLAGVGLPDIPMFTAMILRTIYQTALSYQFDYNNKTEQVFILRLIEASLARGTKAEDLSNGLDEYMRRVDKEGYEYYGSINDYVYKTSKAMSDEMLYLKFLQTIPVVGVAGGLSNPIYLNRIKNYADVKYKKRRLMIRLREAKKEREERTQISVYEE